MLNQTNDSAVSDHMPMLSEEHAKIYDRQIRLWGVETQNRLNQSRILVYGMNGLSAEICKNIVLSGVGLVHIMDSQLVTQFDLGCNFLVREANIGENRAKACHPNLQELNPLMKVTFEEVDSLSVKPKEFFNNFDFIILNNAKLEEQIKINNICREKNILFIATNTFGLIVTSFHDYLDNFEYKLKADKGTIQKSDSFVPLETALQANLAKVRNLSKMWLGVMTLLIYQAANNNILPAIEDGQALFNFKENGHVQKYLPSVTKAQLDMLTLEFCSILCRFAHAEINAVCAVAGGELGQEVISVISRDRTPLNNFFVYDAFETFSGIIEKLH
ncbi:hypothetical protein C9374_014253 [Naegleria lovaniensis]|uniref:THIF-type NAD/FAD binding fold domain-containing protein n=1 Tax=Naegleria lovaniensis TaxID=51637 RepID=A0AA88GCP7_NAELO|nr:uncharacterized protein C9374_014253 [Naegleria lovaniensis]KAG2370759.1 hypothetical protein C9374_014253 [Naegleria lovaniensis]